MGGGHDSGATVTGIHGADNAVRREAARLANLGIVFPVGRLVTVVAIAAAATVWSVVSGSTLVHLCCASALCFVFYCLDSLQHEAVHGFLSARRRVNRFVGLCTSVPTLRSYSEYRAYHLLHHAFAAGSEDPEGSHVYPLRRRLVALPALTARFWAGRIVGAVAVSVRGYGVPYLRTARQRRAVRNEVVITALVMLPVVAALPFSAAARWCWLYPFLGYVLIVFPLAHTFEHFGAVADGAADRVELTSTVRLWPPVAWMFGYGNLHTAHHLFPRVAGRHLPSLHAVLVNSAPGVQVYRGYLGFFRAALRGLPPRGPAGRA